MTHRPATTPDEIAHIDSLLEVLFFGVVKVTKTDGTEIVGKPLLSHYAEDAGVVAYVTLTTLDGQQTVVDLLDITTAVNAFPEYGGAFAAAGLLDLKAGPTVH